MNISFTILIPTYNRPEALLRAANAVLQPSHFEGWSTVLEDARVVGARVIASDFPVHIEQNLLDARYFSLGKERELADQMKISLAQSHLIEQKENLLKRHESIMKKFAENLIRIFKLRQ